MEGEDLSFCPELQLYKCSHSIRNSCRIFDFITICTMNLRLQCKNLKIKIRYTKKLEINKLKGEQVSMSVRKSCIILRRLKTTVTIYNHSPHVLHVTGITRQPQLDEFLTYLLMNLKQCPVEYKVDNSMFSCKMNNDIDLKTLVGKLPEQAPYYCVYKRTIFPN